MPKISVIIPLYNKEKTIKKTIESVLNQTFTDYELLVVNDGSTDNSLEIVRKINDSRIRIIDKQNEGVSATRNRGAKEAKYNLLFFLDADDLIYSNCLESLINLHNKYKDADLWSANYEERTDDIKKSILSKQIRGYISQPHKQIFYGKWHFRIGSYIISKQSFNAIGGFPTNIDVGEDFYFLNTFCSYYKVAYIPDVVMSYMQEYRGLSRKGIDYRKTVEWRFDFKTYNHWQKLTCASLLTKRTIKALLRFDFIQFFSFVNKFRMLIVYGIYAVVKQLYK